MLSTVSLGGGTLFMTRSSFSRYESNNWLIEFDSRTVSLSVSVPSLMLSLMMVFSFLMSMDSPQDYSIDLHALNADRASPSSRDEKAKPALRISTLRTNLIYEKQG